MKGINLLLAAFLCLVTSGAWVRCMYNQGDDNGEYVKYQGVYCIYAHVYEQNTTRAT